MGGLNHRRASILSAAAALSMLVAGAANAQEDTIKVGVLHSLSGTMAISETTLKDVMLMLIEKQNEAGGVLGKQLEPVVVDPASDWPLFAEKARELIEVEGVAATFGCWTSVSRKSVLPVFEELNSLLFYPVQYEGEESSKNVFYTGAAPNQQAHSRRRLSDGGRRRRALGAGRHGLRLSPHHQQDPRSLSQGQGRGRRGSDDQLHAVRPCRLADHRRRHQGVRFSAGKKTAVVSTINGDANVPFYKELGNQGIAAEDIPVVAFSVGEEELAGIDTEPLVGHLAAWNYFMSVESDENDTFIEDWHAFIESEDRVTNDPMEAHYIGFQMWVEAVEKAGTTEPDAVIDAIVGVTVPNLSGGYSRDDAESSHHQAGADRRDPGRRSVRHRLRDARSRSRRYLVRLFAGQQGPDLGLARPDALRQFQHRNRPVPAAPKARASSCGLTSHTGGVSASGGAPPVFSDLPPPCCWAPSPFSRPRHPQQRMRQTLRPRIQALAEGSFDDKAEAIKALAATGDPAVARILEVMREGDLYQRKADDLVVITEKTKA